MTFQHGLTSGDELNNTELSNLFKCSIRGGVRKSKDTETVVLVADHTISVYKDEWVGDIFYYPGVGLRGDQDLEYWQNKMLAESLQSDYSFLLFEVFESGVYTFIGEVELAGDLKKTKQPDIDNNERWVWVFPFKLKDMNDTTPFPLSIIRKKEEQIEKIAKSLSEEELLIRIGQKELKSEVRKAITNVYERNSFINEFVKRKANGICQLCEKQAPFKDKKKKPFLEIHHIDWLSKGGEDSLSNTVALCPNCHRKMHILNLEEDRVKLKYKVHLFTE